MEVTWRSLLAAGSGLYVLNGDGIPVPELSLQKWAAWKITCDTTLAWDQIGVGAGGVGAGAAGGNVTVSTIFLGVNMSLRLATDAAPILWETMIFGGKHHGTQQRYTSRDAALRGHQLMIARVREDWQPDVQTDMSP